MEAVGVWLIATCHTPGCPVEGQHFVCKAYPVPDSDPELFNVVCGQCGQPVTDLVATDAPTS